MTPSVTVIKLVQSTGSHISPYGCKIEGGPHVKEEEELLSFSDWSPYTQDRLRELQSPSAWKPVVNMKR